MLGQGKSASGAGWLPARGDEPNWASLTPAPSAQGRPFRVAETKAHLQFKDTGGLFASVLVDHEGSAFTRIPIELCRRLPNLAYFAIASGFTRTKATRGSIPMYRA